MGGLYHKILPMSRVLAKIANGTAISELTLSTLLEKVRRLHLSCPLAILS